MGTCSSAVTIDAPVSPTVTTSAIVNADSNDTISPSLKYAQSMISLKSLSMKQSTKWKFRLTRNEAVEMFEAEGSIPPDVTDDELLLRVCLDDPIFLYRIGHFSKKQGRKFELLLCWADILEFKSIDVLTSDFLVSKALHIFHKYVKNKPAVSLDLSMPDEWRNELQQTLRCALDGKIVIAVHIFDAFQQQCLRKLNVEMFQEYKQCEQYDHALRDMRKEYNHIQPNDYVYLNRLGQGTNGVVVHAVKKSTGRHYALKIQPKTKLLDSFSDDLTRVMSERNVVLSCSHPFVISMHNSFQTTGMVFMALDLGVGGTLHSALFACKMGGMSEARIKFYCAEICLALNHIHQLGLIYRDLKLQNVVLNEDGHIRLIDLGEAVNVLKSSRAPVTGKDGFLFSQGNADYAHVNRSRDSKQSSDKTTNSRVYVNYNNNTPSHMSANSHNSGAVEANSMTNNSSSVNSNTRKSSDKSIIEKIVKNLTPNSTISNPFTHKQQQTNSLSIMLNPNRHSSRSRDLSHVHLVRAKSIVGTNGYMAPELAVLECSNVREVLKKIGYTKAVDFWALGVMAYQLFTGTMPFEHSDVMCFMEWHVKGEVHPQYQSAHDALNNSNITPIFKSFLKDTLQIDESCRLGAGAHGFNRLKKHAFFDSIQWTALGQQQVTPPFFPPSNECMEDETQHEFEPFMRQIGLTDWIHGRAPSSEEQQFFMHWDYISPTMLKAEMGLGLEMEASDAILRDKTLSWVEMGCKSARRLSSAGSLSNTIALAVNSTTEGTGMQRALSTIQSQKSGGVSTLQSQKSDGAQSQKFATGDIPATATVATISSAVTLQGMSAEVSGYSGVGRNGSPALEGSVYSNDKSAELKRYYAEVVTTTTGVSEDNEKVLALSRKVPATALEVLRSLEHMEDVQCENHSPAASLMEVAPVSFAAAFSSDKGEDGATAVSPLSVDRTLNNKLQ